LIYTHQRSLLAGQRRLAEVAEEEVEVASKSANVETSSPTKTNELVRRVNRELIVNSEIIEAFKPKNVEP